MKWNTDEEGADVATELDRRAWPRDTAVVSQASDAMRATTLSSTNPAFESVDLGRYGSRTQAKSGAEVAVKRVAALGPGEKRLLGPHASGFITIMKREVTVMQTTLELTIHRPKHSTASIPSPK